MVRYGYVTISNLFDNFYIEKLSKTDKCGLIIKWLAAVIKIKLLLPQACGEHAAQGNVPESFFIRLMIYSYLQVHVPNYIDLIFKSLRPPRRMLMAISKKTREIASLSTACPVRPGNPIPQ